MSVKMGALCRGCCTVEVGVRVGHEVRVSGGGTGSLSAGLSVGPGRRELWLERVSVGRDWR